jgi:spore coat polysaccharide biosynthesis protein SpsF (cytidylyltransferase family)
MVTTPTTGRVAAIIQARMGSSRLPGKVLAEIGGHPLLGLLLERLRRTPSLGGICVATSDLPGDDAVADFCAGAGIACFRGSERDVLDRFHGAAAMLGTPVLARITADCPLVCPEVVEGLIREFFAAGADYGVTSPRHAEGLDCEVFSASALEAAWREADRPSDREHVTPFIARQGDRFKRVVLENADDDSAYRITVDEPRDLEAVRRIAEAFGARVAEVAWPEIRAFLHSRPDIRGINAAIERNEGYRKSVEAEQQ